MILLTVITILCAIVAFSNLIAKPIQIFFKRPTPEERKLIREIAENRKDLLKISMRDNYTDYVKAERKILGLEKILQTMQNKKFASNFAIDYGIKYAMKGVGSFVLLLISLYFRSTPVVIFEKNFNFAPFGGVMNFPTGVDGAVSVPFWIFVSSFTLQSITDYLKI